MKAALASAAISLAAPLAAQPAGALPGVANEETTIPSGGITQFHRGKGDVLFVLDRVGHWYRLGLNEGCLSTAPRIYSLAFSYSGGIQRIDRFTQVFIRDSGGRLGLNCRIDSIRRSEAPPQVDSKSPVTLD